MKREGSEEIIALIATTAEIVSVWWDEAVRLVALGEIERPVWIVKFDPMKETIKNLDALFDREVHDLRREMDEGDRHERDASTHLTSGGRAL